MQEPNTETSPSLNINGVGVRLDPNDPNYKNMVANATCSEIQRELGKKCTYVSPTRNSRTGTVGIKIVYGGVKVNTTLPAKSYDLTKNQFGAIIDLVQKQYNVKMGLQKEYENLLTSNVRGDSNDLLELFPGMTGVWEEDKDNFKEAYREHQATMRLLEESEGDWGFEEY